MPSIVTHHIFANDVFQYLPHSIQEKIEKPIYHIFAQSFDNLFYYQFLTPWKGENIRDFGEKAHSEKTNLYFKNILEYIKKNKLEKKKEILSYLYGILTHYILDSTCHPFIFYYTGYKRIDQKYIGLHEKMEVNLDAYFYEQKYHQKLSQVKLADTLLSKVHFSNDLKKCLDEVFSKTFHYEDMGSIYEQSVKTGNLLLKLGVTDRSGIKKQIYKIKDTIIPSKERKYQYLSFHVTEINKNYLNLEHQKWYHPANHEENTASFLDLYNEALEKTVQIILKIEDYFQGNLSLKQILKIIGDNSYITGLPWKENKELKYFKH